MLRHVLPLLFSLWTARVFGAAASQRPQPVNIVPEHHFAWECIKMFSGEFKAIYSDNRFVQDGIFDTQEYIAHSLSSLFFVKFLRNLLGVDELELPHVETREAFEELSLVTTPFFLWTTGDAKLAPPKELVKEDGAKAFLHGARMFVYKASAQEKTMLFALYGSKPPASSLSSAVVDLVPERLFAPEAYAMTSEAFRTDQLARLPSLTLPPRCQRPDISAFLQEGTVPQVCITESHSENFLMRFFEQFVGPVPLCSAYDERKDARFCVKTSLDVDKDVPEQLWLFNDKSCFVLHGYRDFYFKAHTGPFSKMLITGRIALYGIQEAADVKKQEQKAVHAAIDEDVHTIDQAERTASEKAALPSKLVSDRFRLTSVAVIAFLLVVCVLVFVYFKMTESVSAKSDIDNEKGSS